MRSYQFDVKLFATVTIHAADKGAAREALALVLDAMEVGEDCIGGINSKPEAKGRWEIQHAGFEPEEGDEPNRIEPEEVEDLCLRCGEGESDCSCDARDDAPPAGSADADAEGRGWA